MHGPLLNAGVISGLLLKPYFIRITGQQIRAGIKVMLQVHAQFHPQYGFSWIVDDINPEYTMGDMMRKRQEIICQLKEEGVYDFTEGTESSIVCRNE